MTPETLGLGGVAHLFDNLVDQLVLHGFCRGHKPIAVSILFDFLQRLAGMLEQYLVEALFYFLEFICVNHNVFRRSFHTSQGLVDHYAGIGQSVSFFGRSGR